MAVPKKLTPDSSKSVRTLFKKGLDGKPFHPGASTNIILNIKNESD